MTPRIAIAADADPLPQLALLAVTFLVIATVLDSGYALLAGRLRQLLAHGGRLKSAERAGAALLTGLGVAIAGMLVRG